jgi:serine/threonine protein kinase
MGTAHVPRSQDDHAKPTASQLWPSAGDSSSGLRDKRAVVDAGGPAPEVGPFELISPIGSTAYGRAFRARHRQQGREVALHFLAFEDDGEGTLGLALPLAVAKCAQLSHPNVIAVEEHGRSQGDDAYYLVTEALDGVSLSTVMEDEGAFPAARALSVGLQIGRALRAAHKLGILHGALNPANVRLIALEAGGERGELARVVGFDCATFSPLSPALNGAYQAPERRQGAAPDARGDVFALGALLFRMLAGEAPTVEAPALRAPLLSSVSADPVPRALEELVARCLEPDPQQRLADLSTLLRGLREVARELNMGALTDDRLTPLSMSSLPPADPANVDADSTGSLFAHEGGARRGGAVWIMAGLIMALAAVWLLWEASSRSRPEPPRGRDGRSEPRRDPL